MEFGQCAGPARAMHGLHCAGNAHDNEIDDVKPMDDGITKCACQQNATCNERLRGTAFSLSQTAHVVIKDGLSYE